MPLKRCLINFIRVIRSKTFFLSIFFFSSLCYATQVKELEIETIKKILHSSSLNQSTKKNIQYSLEKKSDQILPLLFEAINNPSTSSDTQWFAIMAVAKFLGKHSIGYLTSLLSTSQDWQVRLAALKSLRAIGPKESQDFVFLLKDSSLIVRLEALDWAREKKMKSWSEEIYAMLFDPQNYFMDKSGKKKRLKIIGEVVSVLGELKYTKAAEDLRKMASRPTQYQDIYSDLDSSLMRMTNQKSPNTNTKAKGKFWSNFKF